MWLFNNWCGYALISFVFVLLLVKIILKCSVGISKSNTCLVNKTVLITGGNSGIGYETALFLASRGARIIIADKDDAKETVNRIIEETNNRNVTYKHLDLSSLDCVRQFAREINEGEDRLDVLINNAGIPGTGNRFTNDGLLETFQVNYYGAFLLTHLLIDLLKKTAPSRIIFTSSGLAFFGNLTLENINTSASKNPYLLDFGNYCNSKLMQIIASNIFAEKLRGDMVTCNAVHPGIVNTNIVRKWRFLLSRPDIHFIVNAIFSFCGKTVWEGSQTTIECALSKKLENVTGKYFSDCKIFPQPRKTGDKEFGAKFWEMSEKLVKLRENEKLKT